MSNRRILYLDDSPRLGEAVPSGFRCNHEWWLQMVRLKPDISRLSITTEHAAALADAITSQIDTLSWQLHMHLWGDDDGVAVDAFVAFLRGGGFHVREWTSYAHSDLQQEHE